MRNNISLVSFGVLSSNSTNAIAFKFERQKQIWLTCEIFLVPALKAARDYRDFSRVIVNTNTTHIENGICDTISIETSRSILYGPYVSDMIRFLVL